MWTSGGSESNQQMQYEAEPAKICGMNNRLDVTYFFVPTDRGYSLLTSHILHALPHLGVACHASGDNLMTDRLYANHKALHLAWIFLDWFAHEEFMACVWQCPGHRGRVSEFHVSLRTTETRLGCTCGIALA